MQTKTTEPKLGINLQRAIKQFNKYLSKQTAHEFYNFRMPEVRFDDAPNAIRSALVTSCKFYKGTTKLYDAVALALIIYSRRLNGNAIKDLWASDIVDILAEHKLTWSEYSERYAIDCLKSIKQSTIDKYKSYLNFPK